MGNKTITFLLFGIVVLLFITCFTIQGALFPAGQPITGYLDSIKEYAEQEKWDDAWQTVNNLEKSWTRAKYALALNYAEADYSLFIDTLSRVKYAVRSKESAEAGNQASAAKELWLNFIKVFPEP